MVARFFLDEDFEHPQEHKAFRLLCSAVSALLTDDAVIVGCRSAVGFDADQRRNTLNTRVFPGSDVSADQHAKFR